MRGGMSLLGIVLLTAAALFVIWPSEPDKWLPDWLPDGVPWPEGQGVSIGGFERDTMRLGLDLQGGTRLLLQGSLFLTRAHVNRWWTLALEVAVLAHGTLVAIMQGEGMWPMFAFGFGGIFVITQMHGLSWSRPVRGLVLAAYVAGVLAVYVPLGWGRLSEVLRIPLIDYAAVFALAGIIGGVIGLLRLLGLPARRVNEPSRD